MQARVPTNQHEEVRLLNFVCFRKFNQTFFWAATINILIWTNVIFLILLC